MKCKDYSLSLVTTSEQGIAVFKLITKKIIYEKTGIISYYGCGDDCQYFFYRIVSYTGRGGIVGVKVVIMTISFDTESTVSRFSDVKKLSHR